MAMNKAFSFCYLKLFKLEFFKTNLSIRILMKAMIFSIFLFTSLYAYSAETPKKLSCLSAREYITTVRFLRSNKAFGLQEKQIQSYADKVSLGCSGASQRFIQVIKLLTKMGIDSNTSMKNALHFASKDEKFTEVFIEIFRQAYDPKRLDLDVLNAMKISLKLTAEFSGNPETALADYKKLVTFCLEKKSMDLPTPKCAFLAMDIASLNQEFDKPVAEPFIALMTFLQEESKGPKLDRNAALKIAQDVIKYGPIAPENFINGYEFSISKNGLSRGLNDAISFGKLMAQRSSKLESK